MAYSTKALPPGTVLREWRLEQVLGVGGFGIVYKGRGIYFDELVAIKEYFPSAISERVEGDTVVPTDSDAEEVHALGLKKFVEEAKLLWNLSKPTRHPNIVSVRSLFEIHGTAYMVMDFEDGVSLSDILKSGRRFTEASLMALIRPISEGLERAHRVGVLHRDIKPPNILVSEDGRPVLIDFGSARFDAGQATSTKVTFHTPPYAAIEQYVKTYDQGPWTDIYALGVVLYECVTGTKPPEVLERMHGGASSALADQECEGFSKPFLRGIDAAMTIRPGDRPQTIPQWLEMFDPGYEPKGKTPPMVWDEAKTRFAAFQEMPEEIVPVTPPVPIAADAPEPDEIGDEADPAPAEALAAAAQAAAAAPEKPGAPAAKPAPSAAKRSLLRPLPIAAGVAVLAALGGGAFVLTSGKSAGDKPGAVSEWIPAISGITAPGVSESAAPIASEAAPSTLQMLVDSAHRAGAPRSAVEAAGAATATLAQLEAELAVLAKQPQATAQVTAQNEKIAALTRTTSANLAAAIAREADGRTARLAEAIQGRPDQRTLAAPLLRARAAVDSAAAVTRSAADPAQALAAARATIAAYGHYGAVHARTAAAARAAPAAAATATALASTDPDDATPSTGGLAGKISEFDAVHDSAKAIASQVVAMGRSAKPKSSDSDAVKDAIRVRQASATQAKAYTDHLNLLARSIRGAKSDSAAQNIISQAKLVRSYLSTLQARSTAAMAASR